MEKIEKLEEFNWVSGRDAITIALCNTIIRKQNEIIDHLNTQPKEEVTAEWLYRKNRKRLEDLTEKELKKMGITKTQDTPEQKEEWEEEFHKRFVEHYMLDDDDIYNFYGYGDDAPQMGSGKEEVDKVISFIKNLLSEREEFTKDELFMLKLATNDIHNKGNGVYDEIGEKIERMLSKLNKKK